MASLLIRIAKWAIWPVGLNRHRRTAHRRPVPPRPAMVRQRSPQEAAAARSFGFGVLTLWEDSMTPPNQSRLPDLASHTAPVMPRPSTKKEAQEVLREHGITGLKVDSIDDGRIYALTGETLMPDNTMRRRAVTVVFVPKDTNVKDRQVVAAVQLEGWLVGDQIPWSSL